MTNLSVGGVAAEQMNSLVRQIHAAAGQENQWHSTLSNIREFFASVSVTLARHQFTSGQAKVDYLVPADQNRVSQYCNQFSVRNPWFLSSTEYTPGRVMTGEELVSKGELIKSDFYRQYLKSYGLHHRLCGVISCDLDWVSFIALHRASNQPGFDKIDVSRMHQILDHLTIALTLHWQLLRAKGIAQMFWSVIDHFNGAAFLVEQDGTVVHQNQKADEVLEQNGGLKLHENKILATTKTDIRALQKAFEELDNPDKAPHPDEGRIVRLTDPALTHQLIITLRQIGSIYSIQSGIYKKLLILTVKSPFGSLAPHHCSFPNLYKLTPAQERLSALIFSGSTISEIAQRLHLSDNTIKSHLKQIYLKTGTHSQVELLQLHVRVCDEHY